MEIKKEELKEILKEQRKDFEKHVDVKLKEQREEYQRYLKIVVEDFSSQVKVIAEQYGSLQKTLD